MSSQATEMCYELSAAERARWEGVDGVIFDIQRYSLHDGPGLRTNVFFKGCPLRCGWCSNPESQQMQPEIGVFAANCIQCGQFAQPCPEQWTPRADGRWKHELLNEYRARAEACPARGVRLLGEHRAAGSIIAEVRRDAPFYDCDGGMTLTGGEPLLQPDLAEALLRLARAECIGAAVETTGCVPWRAIERCLPYLDTVLFDLKHTDPESHRAHTGVDNALILANLRRLAGLRAPVIVRVPLIPGFNASSESLRAIAEFVSGLELLLGRVDLLPYHTFGRAKYRALGRPYPWQGHERLSDGQVAEWAELFAGYGLTVTIGG